MSVTGNIRFEADGATFTAFFGFAAMEAMETHFNAPFNHALRRVFPQATPEVLTDAKALAELGAGIRIKDLGAVFGFALLKHHPGLTSDAIAEIIDDIGIARATEIVGESLRAAIGDPSQNGGDGAAKVNPPRSPRPKRTG